MGLSSVISEQWLKLVFHCSYTVSSRGLQRPNTWVISQSKIPPLNCFGLGVCMFVPQEQILQCTQCILITVSLDMFQYGARKAHHLRTEFSVMSKSYWFLIRKLHCVSFLHYNPQLLQRLWLLKSVLRVTEIKHLLFTTKCYAKANSESL